MEHNFAVKLVPFSQLFQLHLGFLGNTIRGFDDIGGFGVVALPA